MGERLKRWQKKLFNWKWFVVNARWFLVRKCTFVTWNTLYIKHMFLSRTNILTYAESIAHVYRLNLVKLRKRPNYIIRFYFDWISLLKQNFCNKNGKIQLRFVKFLLSIYCVGVVMYLSEKTKSFHFGKFSNSVLCLGKLRGVFLDYGTLAFIYSVS